jgi:hypothetical protein
MRYMTPVGKSMVDKAKLLEVSLRLLPISPIGISPTFLHVYSPFVYHRTYIIVETDGVVK